MGSIKSSGKKKRLTSAGRQTRWAPFWLMPKIFGAGRARHVHPSRITAKKRHWRRENIRA